VHDRLGARAIAQRLTDEGIPCPSAHDPERNRHRAGNGAAWSRSAIRAILANPRYLGRQVWGRAHGHEVLIDPEDVAQGYSTVMRPVDPSRWVWSERQVHEAIIEPEVFAAAQEQLGLGRDRTTDRRPPAKRAYMLRGRIWCAACGRKMEADTSGGLARYRCRLSGGDYARNEALDGTHPRSAAVSEGRVTRTIDGWLATLFDAEHAEATIEAFATADTEQDERTIARAERARTRVQECDTKLARYKAALDAGADPVVVGGWIAETQAERVTAARDLHDATPVPPLSEDEVRAMVEWFAESADRFHRAMGSATAEARQALYDSIGLRAYWTPGVDAVEVSLAPVEPWGKRRVGGGTCTLAPRGCPKYEYLIAA
jgi:site-specific DNA recombinase